jgi:hypothetical protein
MNKQQNFKIKKDEILCTQYSRQDSSVTHILCRKINSEPDKMWILWSVETDGSLKKVAQGSNPLKLEDKIDYIKAVKDTYKNENDTI